MKRQSTIIALAFSLTFITLACGNSAANMSEDEKYKLFFAATQTRDPMIQTETAKKIGLINSDGTPTAYQQKFIEGAVKWAEKNASFVQEVNTPEKAKAYVKSHTPS